MPKPTIMISGYVCGLETKESKAGNEYLSFSIPVDAWSKNQRDGYKIAYSGTGYTATSWHRCVLFGDKAQQAKTWLENKQYVTVEVSPNGKAVNGSMYPSVYEDKASYDWIVREITSPVEKEQELYDEPPFVEEDEIPF